MALSSYRIFFTPTARPVPPVDVHDVLWVDTPPVVDAVLAHVAARWPGAHLDVRINAERMTGRVLAGPPPAGRRVLAFSLAEYTDDGTPPPDPRGDVAEDQAADDQHAGATR